MQIGATGFKEEPLPAWLKNYLMDPKENESYDAWSWADKVWSIYSFFSFKETKDVEVAFEELAKKAGQKAMSSWLLLICSSMGSSSQSQSDSVFRTR